MNLFLASNLAFVWDVVLSHVDLSWKKVWCVRNAATEWWWKNARRNTFDQAFFDDIAGVACLDIDLRWSVDWEDVFSKIDVLFVWWWDTLYLRDLSESSWLHEHIWTFLDEWGIYMWTSAWAMLASKDVYFPHEGRSLAWFWYITPTIIPHRWSLAYRADRDVEVEKIYNHDCSYILLGDTDIIVWDRITYKVCSTQKYTRWDIDEIRSKYE